MSTQKLFLYRTSPESFSRKLTRLRGLVQDVTRKLGIDGAEWLQWEKGDFSSMTDERYSELMIQLGLSPWFQEIAPKLADPKDTTRTQRAFLPEKT